MKMNRSTLPRALSALLGATGLALGLGLALPAAAQEFPSKGPIRLIVGFAPGGGTDAIARAINVRMGPSSLPLGQWSVCSAMLTS